MTTSSSSSSAEASSGNSSDSSGAERPSTRSAGEASSEDGRGGSEASSIDADALDDLPGTKRKDGEELDIGEVFELLKNERRRRVIRFLKEQEDGTTTLDVLAEHIAALENDIDVSQLSSSQRKRVYIGLYQCHLPKMDDFGVVEFRKNRGIIHLRDTTLLDPYLPDLESDEEEADDAEADTGRAKLAAAAGVAVVALVGATGIGPLAVVPGVFWTLLCAAALLFSATS
ncbi:DUF7344 domain-containing protein [Natronomonas marina]|uniref:DUF7344 domain-containing protein n=1 Tax=Natronomonas marina TaxID=2961939 RepID=UPI0020C9F1B5|nr:hypothetical protein [Natronomonas marina]